MWPPGGPQESNQLLDLCIGQVAQLPLMAVADGLAQLGQEGQSTGCDADLDNATILDGAVALDEAAILKLVEQARDVGGARDQPGGEVQRGDLAGMFAAEQPQGIVLLRSQAVLTEEFLFQHAKAIVGAPQAEEGLLLDRIEAARRARWAWPRGRHEGRLGVATIVVQTTFVPSPPRCRGEERPLQ